MERKVWKKRFIYALIIGFCLFLFLILGRRLYLPDSFIIHKIEKNVSAALGMQLDIEDGSFHFLSDTRLEGITLKDSTGARIAAIESISLRYRLLPLFQRKLVILRLTIVNPQVTYDHVIESGKSADLHSSSRDSDKESVIQLASNDVTQPSFGFSLPIKLEIDNLTVENARAAITAHSTEGTIKTELNGIFLEAKQIHIVDSTDYSGQFTLGSEDTITLAYISDVFNLNSRSYFNLNATGSLDPALKSLNIALRCLPEFNAVLLDNAINDFSLSEIALSANANLIDFNDLNIDDIRLLFGGDTILVASAEIGDILGYPRLNLQVHEGKVFIDDWLPIIRGFLSMIGWESILDDVNITGLIRIENSLLTGTMLGANPELEAVVNLAIINAGLTHGSLPLRAQGFNFDLSYRGAVYPAENISFILDADAYLCSVETTGIDAEPLVITDLKSSLTASADKDLENLDVELRWAGKGPFQSDQKGDVNIQIKRLNREDPLASSGLAIRGGCSIKDLPLDKFVRDRGSGSLSAAADFVFRGLNDIEVGIGVLCPDLTLCIDTDTVSIPPLMAHSESRWNLSENFGQLKFEELKVEIDPYGDASLVCSYKTDGSWDISSLDLEADFTEIAPLFNTLLPENLTDLILTGDLHFSGEASGNLNPDKAEFHHQIDVDTENIALKLPYYKSTVDSIVFSSTFAGNKDCLSSSGEIEIGKLVSEMVSSKPYRQIKASWDGSFDLEEQEASVSFQTNLSQLGLETSGDVILKISKEEILGQAKLGLQFHSDSLINLTNEVQLAGESELACDLLLSESGKYELTGEIECNNLTATYADEFRLEDLNLYMPYETTFVIDSNGVAFGANSDTYATSSDPVLFASNEHLFPANKTYGTVSCGLLRYTDYNVSNLEGIISFQQDRLESPGLKVDAYDGVLKGAFEVSFPVMIPDSIGYWMRVSAHEINTALLRQSKAKKGEDNQISAFARFSGQGINPNGHFDLAGSVDITRIGRQVADNLLRFMDPNQTDPSIQTYRGYLKRGWGVKVFTFGVKDDFVYTSIIPLKPPITKLDMFILSRLIGLGKSITFGRVPLKFFLNTPVTANL